MIINNLTLLPKFRIVSSQQPLLIRKAYYDHRYKITISDIRRHLHERNTLSSSKQNELANQDYAKKIVVTKEQVHSFAYKILLTKVRKLA